MISCATYNLTSDGYKRKFAKNIKSYTVSEPIKDLSLRIKQQVLKCLKPITMKGSGAKAVQTFSSEVKSQNEDSLVFLIPYVHDFYGSFNTKSQLKDYVAIIEMTQLNEKTQTYIYCRKKEACNFLGLWIANTTTGCPNNFSPL
jgi:hypothetical protein